LSPARILAEVQGLGVTLSVISGGRLAARPKGRLSADVREKISAHKAALVDHLLSLSPHQLPVPPKRGRYAPDGNRCSDCNAPLGLQGGTVRLAFANDDGSLTCRNCVCGETEKRRMRARGVAI
jgi:TubC N-terminal docking domain